jgi:hypothetical protein
MHYSTLKDIIKFTSELFQKQRKRRMTLISHAKNSTKLMWQIINKTIRKSGKSLQDIWLKNGRVEITHPQNVAESSNSYFIDKVDQLVGMEGLG